MFVVICYSSHRRLIPCLLWVSISAERTQQRGTPHCSGPGLFKSGKSNALGGQDTPEAVSAAPDPPHPLPLCSRRRGSVECLNSNHELWSPAGCHSSQSSGRLHCHTDSGSALSHTPIPNRSRCQEVPLVAQIRRKGDGSRARQDNERPKEGGRLPLGQTRWAQSLPGDWQCVPEG